MFWGHGLGAIHAQDIDRFCSADGVSTARTYIFPGTAGLFGFGLGPAKLAGAVDGQLIPPMLGGAEPFQLRAGLGDAEADFFIIVDDEAPLFSFGLEALIMIGIPAAGVLDAIDTTVHVYHFVDQGSDGGRRWAVQAFGPNIDFIAIQFALAVVPDLAASEMSIGFGAGLDGDHGLWECTFKVFFVQRVKGIFEELHSLGNRHFESSLSKIFKLIFWPYSANI